MPGSRKLSHRLALALGTGLLSLIGVGWSNRITPTQEAPAQLPAAQDKSVDSETHQAMVDAINDEYRARAYYSAVTDKFGDVLPFSNIVQAEDRHVQLWENQFAYYGLPVPEDTFAGAMAAPDTLLAACQGGVEAERADAQMYENFLTTITDPNLQAIFTRLRQVSLENHLPAFEQCVASGGAYSPQGGGPGRGQGGMGHSGGGQGRPW